MNNTQNLKSRLQRLWVTWASVFMFLYFAFHIFHGENSVNTLKALHLQEAELRAEIALLDDEAHVLGVQIDGLSGAVVDADLLEGQVRDKLGFVHADEVVLFVTE